MPKSRNRRPDVDSLLPDVEEEIRGGDSSEDEEDQPASRQDGKSSSPQDGMSASRQADQTSERSNNNFSSDRSDQMESDTEPAVSPSVLARQIEVLMNGPDAPFAEDFPELKARANGYLSQEVEGALQQATAVLKNHHDGVSKSLLIDYAIRLALWELRQNAEESQLVKWLDEVGGDS
jgi:hypothetical protein